MDSNEKCEKDCNAKVEPLCNAQEQQQAALVCKELFSKVGRFKTCLKKMSDQEIKDYTYACEFDLCHTNDNIQVSLKL